MINRRYWKQRGIQVLKAVTAAVTMVSLISLAQLSACAATSWSFWGEEETELEESELESEEWADQEEEENIFTKTVYKNQTGEYLDLGEDFSGEVVFSIDNPKVLDISEDGELIPLKVGNAVVTATVAAQEGQKDQKNQEVQEEQKDQKSQAAQEAQLEEGQEEERVYQYYISVCKKKAYKAVKKAENAIGAAYSQEKRMKKGYYDCSSLVWRSYSPYGIDFDESTWAPTAADQGLWCDENEKTISEKAVEISAQKLVPGDLLFYAKSSDNGRYKKIYHVAMFEGYEAEVDEETGETILSGTIIEADGTSVVSRTYRADSADSDRSIVITARPTK